MGATKCDEEEGHISGNPEMVRRNRLIPKYFVPMDKLDHWNGIDNFVFIIKTSSLTTKSLILISLFGLSFLSLSLSLSLIVGDVVKCEFSVFVLCKGLGFRFENGCLMRKGERRKLMVVVGLGDGAKTPYQSNDDST